MRGQTVGPGMLKVRKNTVPAFPLHSLSFTLHFLPTSETDTEMDLSMLGCLTLHF